MRPIRGQAPAYNTASKGKRKPWRDGEGCFSLSAVSIAEVVEGFIRGTSPHRLGGHQYKTGQTAHDPSENSSVPDPGQPMNQRWICQAIQPSTAPGIRSIK